MDNCLFCGDILQNILCYKTECILLESITLSPYSSKYIVEYQINNTEEYKFITDILIESLTIYINKPLCNLFQQTEINSIDFFKSNISKKIIEDIKNIEFINLKSDYDLCENIQQESYGILKYYIKNNSKLVKYEKQLSSLLNNINIFSFHYSNIYDVDIEEFEKKVKTEESHYLFHGSSYKNWGSIFINGLKNYSKTCKMTNGNAFGDGIYFSNDIILSHSYSTMKRTGDSIIIGVFEVIKNTKYSKTENIFVVSDEKDVRLKYLFKTDYKNTIYIKNIGDYFINRKNQLKKSVNNYIFKMKNKRLLMEINKIMNHESLNKKDYILHEIENMMSWTIDLINFDKDSVLSKDMKKLLIENITIEIKFNEQYPIQPPKVRMVKPAFKRMTGHITEGGGLCFELLTNQGWSPAISIECLIINIKTIISIDGQLEDNQELVKEYNEKKADAGFLRAMKAHNWK